MLILKSNGQKIKYQVLFFTRSTSTMKNVIVRNIYTVGMHHWGSHEIPLEVKDKLINGPCYLKAKQHINKFSKKKGPMQNISLGFKCSESNISLIRDITEHYERVVF